MSRSMWVVLVGVTIAGSLTPAAPAPAAAPVWSISPSPNPPAPARARLQAVTCPSPSSCFAVGFYHDHYRHNDLPLVGRWTGSTWSIAPAPLPTGGSEDARAVLRDIACPTTTRCFAVGDYYDGIESFSQIIVQWNGTTWSVVLASNPPGLQSSILFGVSCRNSTTCFAVGTIFDGTEFSPFVERWKGTSWMRVLSPNPTGGSAGSLTDVSCNGTTCFAVGDFISNTTHTSQTLVERWNGQVWSVVETPSPPGASHLSSVSCPKATRCVAVGSRQADTTFTSRTLIERWNGTAWSIIASPNVPNADANRLSGVSCASASSCFAVGSSIDDLNGDLAARSLIERWNGTAWSIVAAPNPGTTRSLLGVSCPASSSCFAVGNYEINGQERTLIDRWNGTSWSVVAQGGFDSRLRRASCTSPTNCFAVGDAFNGFAGNTLIERWNGTSWAIVASPNPAGTARRLSGISCPSATMCMAVGQYVSGATTKTLVERWNGSAWSIVASPNAGPISTLQAVRCPTVTSCFAVGTARSGFTNRTLIEHWNGSSWSIVPSPNAVGDNVLSGIACPTATNCFAVGTAGSDSATSTLVERWNGATWSIVASPSSSSDYNHLDDVTCTSATNCFAVGGSQTFFLDDGNTLIERWNGATWSIVPSPNGFGHSVLSGVACASATSCTAVGSASASLGIVSTDTLAETWNGTSWSVVETPNRSEAYASQLFGVACRGTGLCFAVGSSTTDIGESTLVERNS